MKAGYDVVDWRALPLEGEIVVFLEGAVRER